MELRNPERILSRPSCSYYRAESRRSWRLLLHLLEYHLRSSISGTRSTHGRDGGVEITGTIGPPGLRTIGANGRIRHINLKVTQACL